MKFKLCIVSLILFMATSVYGGGPPIDGGTQAATTDALTLTSTPITVSVPGIKPVPVTTDEALSTGADLVSAVKAKRYWLAVALGIFLTLFTLNGLKVWQKIGTRWAWLAVGLLSIAAGCFAAFDRGGFNWGTFLSYVTAGPTIAWVRDFMKDDGFFQAKKKE